MDTSRMLHLKELSTNQIFALFSQSEKLKEIAVNFYDTMERALVRSQVVDLVNHYDIGKVIDVFEIFGGYVNKSFGIYVEKDGERHEYFVRKYKKGITEKEIMLEHSMIECAIANGLTVAAGLIHTKEGHTFVKMPEQLNGTSQDRYYAIYEYLSGEDKYTWVTPYLTDKEYASSAEVLATFHNSTRNFDPKGLERVEPKIMEFLPTLKQTFRDYAEQDLTGNQFHDYFVKNLDDILKVIDLTVESIPEEAINKMPMNPIHCDLHPGNFKYENEQAVGIFDFDWAKIDLRLFDLGLGLVYFCSSWEPESDGVLRIDKCAVFLDAYQKKLQELGGLPPLNETEIQCLPAMIQAGNIYLINWAVAAYYPEILNLNVYEYTAYLSHQVKLMRYIEAHKAEIAEMARSIAVTEKCPA